MFRNSKLLHCLRGWGCFNQRIGVVRKVGCMIVFSTGWWCFFLAVCLQMHNGGENRNGQTWKKELLNGLKSTRGGAVAIFWDFMFYVFLYVKRGVPMGMDWANIKVIPFA
ncbi:hypothetical protein BSKO_13113 [Bryopsis sp. KO-2023]|nr:hypothetical protein BSKO_13113 [Bryopsis sp. KO-2023]